jgi:transketolase
VLRQSPQDKVTVIGAGVTLHEALKAADQLKAEGTAVRVIDLYCVKPIDGKELAKEIAATGGRLITVEDHWGEGGIGEAVLSALAQASVAPAKSQLIAVREMPHSGKPDELVDAFAFPQDILWRRCAEFHSKPRGAPQKSHPESSQLNQKV